MYDMGNVFKRLFLLAEQPQPSKPANHSLEAASKMVPVPESLMSPDYQDPIYDIQRTISKPTNNSVNNISNTSSQSSNSSIHEEKHRHIVQPNKALKGSPKLTKSATSSPKLRTKIERKGSLKAETKEEKNLNGLTKQQSVEVDHDKLEMIKLASNQRRQKRMSVESMAAVTIQKMWRGYRSRNLNKDTLRILHAIQAARARQHIQYVSELSVLTNE
jgi:centrosomal protein CEP97